MALSHSSIPLDLIKKLRSARSVTVLTGAGISAESGMPTFREAQTGIWSQYDPQELATPQAFQRNARLVWEWYSWRRELAARAQPNLGHLALVDMEERFPTFTLITQNVDGLHHRAGSRRVIELHGSLQRSRCSEENRLFENWDESIECPPLCPHCGAKLRPDVVWFGESLPADALQAAFQASQDCEVFFSIGTSGVVQPAASLPYLAQRVGAVMVEINPEATPLSADADYTLTGAAGSLLPELVRALFERQTGAERNIT